jgi:hypothetical protein
VISASLSQALLADYIASGARNPTCLQGLLPRQAPAAARVGRPLLSRQDRHSTLPDALLN